MSPNLISLRHRRAAFMGALVLLMTGCASHSQPQDHALQHTDLTSNAYQLMETTTNSASNSRVRHLVLHYTDDDLKGSLASLTGPDVSAHYLLAEPANGDALPRVYPLVSETRRAWHAGVSQWADRGHLNDTSIGIEIVNPGPLPLAPLAPGTRETLATGVARRWAPEREFAAWDTRQITALIALVKPIISRHDIKPEDVVAHSDIAPDRKTDPGPRFPWKRLHDAGIGAWPDEAQLACFRQVFSRQGMPAPDALLKALADYGYPVESQRPWLAISAFQAHFRAGAITGSFDAESAAILLALNARYRAGDTCQETGT